MGGTWSFQLTRATGEYVGALSVATARKLSFFVDGPASAGWQMPGQHPQTALVSELGTDLFVSRNGRALFRGRVGTSSDALNADTITSTFSALDYRGMLGRRLLWQNSTRQFNQVDQAAIAWQMISDTQALAGGNLGIVKGAAPNTGVLASVTYDPGKNLGEALNQLGNTQNGFEWEVDAALNFNLFYPARGRQTGIVLEYGRDLVAVNRTLDATAFANAIRFNGAGNTVADELAVSSFDPEIGRWDGQASDPNQTTQAAVDARAHYELNTSSVLTPAFKVTMLDGRWDPNQIWVGDTVQLVVNTGRLAVNGNYRVVQIDVNLSDDGGETVDLAVQVMPASLTARLDSYNSRIQNLERLGYVPDVPIGGMMFWPTSTPPTYYMWADGSALSRTAYPTLFAAIGTTFGAGDGSTTFNLPDCRSRTIVAVGAGAGLTARSLGQTGGEETHALTGGETGLHSHPLSGNTSPDSVDHTHTGTSSTMSADHSHSLGTLATGADTPAHVHNLGWNAPAGQLSGGTYSAVVPGGATATSTPTATHSHPVSGVIGGTSANHTHNLTTGIESATHVHAMPANTANSGAGSPHNTMPPWIAIGVVIKVASAQTN